MTTSDDNLVKSNILLGALHVFLVISAYILIIYVAHIFLREIYGINMLSMLDSFSELPIPIIAEMFSFLGFLAESAIIHAVILSLLYAAYVSNYELKLEEETLHMKKGFLFIENHKFSLENIQSVYTEKYTFFLTTKQLCIKTLDEDIIKIPFVPNADKFKDILVNKVRAHNVHIETTERLHEPVKNVSPQPQ